MNEQAENPKVSVQPGSNDNSTRDKTNYHTPSTKSFKCTCNENDHGVKSKKWLCSYCSSKHFFGSDDKRVRKNKPMHHQKTKQSFNSRPSSDGTKENKPVPVSRSKPNKHQKATNKLDETLTHEERQVEAASCNPPSVRKKTNTTTNPRQQVKSEKLNKQHEFCKAPPPGFAAAPRESRLVFAPPEGAIRSEIKTRKKVNPPPGF